MATLMLASCNQPPSLAPAKDVEDNGRYQMMPGPDGKAYVLDTKTGTIRLCAANKVFDGMSCGASETQL